MISFVSKRLGIVSKRIKSGFVSKRILWLTIKEVNTYEKLLSMIIQYLRCWGFINACILGSFRIKSSETTNRGSNLKFSIAVSGKSLDVRSLKLLQLTEIASFAIKTVCFISSVALCWGIWSSCMYPEMVAWYDVVMTYFFKERLETLQYQLLPRDMLDELASLLLRIFLHAHRLQTTELCQETHQDSLFLLPCLHLVLLSCWKEFLLYSSGFFWNRGMLCFAVLTNSNKDLYHHIDISFVTPSTAFSIWPEPSLCKYFCTKLRISLTAPSKRSEKSQ